LAVLAGCFCLVARAPAAPPALTYLFPAGAQQGTTVEVTAGGTFGRWPVQAWVDGQGVAVQALNDKGKLSVAVATDAVPGTYWVRLCDEEGASSLRPFVVGTLPEVAEQEPNNDPKKPHVLASAQVTVNGRLNPGGDVDGFAVQLRKGQTLVASLEANGLLGSPMDGVLQVVSADGFVLATNHDYHDLDPQIVFPVPADGTYVVRTFAFPATPDSGIRFAGGELYIYRLTLTTGGFADHPSPLAVSRSNPGQVELRGWNIPDAATTLAVASGDGSDSVVLAHPQVANTAVVRLEPHPTAVEVEPNDRQHPQPLELPVTVSGRIDPAGDVDVYHFQAKKGQKLFFQVEARRLGYPLDPVLRLTDAAGQTLAQMDDPGSRRDRTRDPEFAYTVPEDGPLRLEVRDLHGAGGFRYVYRLRAVVAEPDYDLTLAADRFVLTPGKPLDIPVTVERRNGFDREIEIRVDGLPEGVTAPPVQSPPTGGGAKSVTLRLTANAGPFAGPIRVVGNVTGQPESVRTARSAVTGLSAFTTRLWLTGLKPAATAAEKPAQP
jgi:hypothetical protein